MAHEPSSSSASLPAPSSPSSPAASASTTSSPFAPSGAIVTRPALGQLLLLAWPIIVTRSAQVVVGVTDAVMVARLGTSALAATTAGATNIYNVLIFPMGIVSIVSSFSSQLIGAGEPAAARRFGWYGLAVALLAGLAALAVIPFLDEVLAHSSYAPAVQALMVEYLALRLLSGGFAVGLEAIGAYYNGLGNTRLPMVAQLFAMGLNLVFNWVLIFGHLGAPALGVKGAALASSIATALAFALLFGCFVRGVGETLQPRPRSDLRLAELVRTLRVGLPSGFNWFIEFAAFSFVINVVYAGLGTTALAAFMAVVQVNSVSFMPAFGIASAGAVFVGHAIGARAHDDVPRTVWLTARTAATWMGCVGITYLLMPRFIMSSFADDASTARDLVMVAAPLLLVSASWQIFDAVAMVLAEALRAAGDTAFTLWARAALAWLVFAPGAWVSVRIFGGQELVAAGWLVLYLALLAVVLWFRFRSGRWRAIELTSGVAGGSAEHGLSTD